MHDIRPYLPELFNQPGSLLYIGARPDAHSWLRELYQAGNQISVLEVWPENVAGLVQWVGETGINILVFAGDVRKVNEIFPGEKFDYIFYWHGPEHLFPHEIEPILEKLEEKTGKILALACPYGVYSQGSHEGNPFEEHKSTLYPDFFELLGFDVATDGKPDEPGGEIVAWKRK